ncbi:hypothetical protein TEA_004188 [Camellia sinensis var. sinensis]|uniref:Bet v I/Major latex protein domain-containing protein n=1 Tax=Camellia sinensis var. sinensis TaxID=542762 RepID=A0A4S4D3A7_CAMSN|nr:hypothetical protein TEA_004188 [Camellia sinensis var. sinensis]
MKSTIHTLFSPNVALDSLMNNCISLEDHNSLSVGNNPTAGNNLIGDGSVSARGKKAHTAQNLSPDKVSKLDLHEGEWRDHGSIKVWTYVTVMMVVVAPGGGVGGGDDSGVTIVVTSVVAVVVVVAGMTVMVVVIVVVISNVGKVETFKEKVTIDDENKTVHLTAVEGHCLDLYKSYNIIYQIIHKGETNVLKITIEYEKRIEDVPPPQKYMDFIIDLVKDLDAKLVMA